MAENTNDVVTVSVIGSNTAPGATATLPSGTVAKTAAGVPNVLVNVVKPLTAIAVRAAHVFLITFFGALGTGAAGITPADWTWKTAALIAAGAAFVETGKNLVTIFADLEQKNPLLTGSI
jgi:hypothetical protein